MKLRSGYAVAGIVAVAAAVPLAGAAMAPAQVQVVGVAAAVLNSVRIRRSGASLPLPAALRQRVALADEVQTGARSQLQILLLDKSVFTVGANARLTIDRFVYDPSRGTGSFGANVARGAFRFMSGRPHTSGGSSIRTPTASIGIRGTVLDGVIGEAAVRIAAGERGLGRDPGGDPATATLVVLRGPGAATQGRAAPGAIDVQAGGRTLTLDRPMLASYIPYPGAAPMGPFTISRAGLQRIQALIFPSLAEQLGFAEPEPEVAAPDGSNPFATMPPPRESRGPPPPGFGPDLSGPPTGQGPGQGQNYIPSLPSGGFQSGPRPTRAAPTPGAPTPPAPTPNNPVTAPPAKTAAPVQPAPQQPAPTPTPPPTLNAAPTFNTPTLKQAAPQPTPTATPTPKPTGKGPTGAPSNNGYTPPR